MQQTPFLWQMTAGTGPLMMIRSVVDYGLLSVIWGKSVGKKENLGKKVYVQILLRVQVMCTCVSAKRG